MGSGPLKISKPRFKPSPPPPLQGRIRPRKKQECWTFSVETLHLQFLTVLNLRLVSSQTQENAGSKYVEHPWMQPFLRPCTGVYVTSRADPPLPSSRFEVCPEAGGKTIVRAKFRAFYRSRILPRDSLETRSRARLERKGKKRKGKKERRGLVRGGCKGRGGVCIYVSNATRLSKIRFLSNFFSPSPIIPDSIFLGRNDLRHGPSPSSGSEEGLEDWSGRKGKEAGWTSTSEIFIITHASSGEEGGFLGNVFEADCFFLMDASNRFLGNRDNGGLFLFLDLKCFMLWIFIWVACIWNTSRSRNN